MPFTVSEASRGNILLRMCLSGPPGSGKSFTALKLATSIAERLGLRTAAGKPAIGSLDTEGDSLSKYAPPAGCSPGKGEFFFFRIEEPWADYSPDSYVERIHHWEQQFCGRGIVLVDSLSHAWMGKGGALEMVDQAAKKARDNRFTAWRDVTPAHNRLVETILNTSLHLIATLRAKTEHVMEEYTDDSGRKKTRVRKIGMRSIQRDGIDYEFDITGDMDVDDNKLIVSKTRCSALKGAEYAPPGQELSDKISDWLIGAPPKLLLDTPEELAKIKRAFDELAGTQAEKDDSFRRLSGGKELSGVAPDQARSIYREMKRTLGQRPPGGPEPPPGDPRPSADKPDPEKKPPDIKDFSAEQIKDLMAHTGAKNRAQLSAWLAKQTGSPEDVIGRLTEGE